MYKKLILITRQFPYGNSENFLESEIVILSRYFREIIIYPSTSSDSMRSVPDNVKVSDEISDEYRRKLYWSVKTLFSVNLYKTIFKYAFRVKSVRALKSLIKYIVSFNIYERFTKSIYLDKNSKLIYSYWYSPVVDALVTRKSDQDRVVCRVHRGDIYEETTELGFYPYRESSIYKIDCIYSISEHGYHYLSEKYKVSNIEVSRLGTFGGNTLNRIDDSGFFIVSVSNMIPIKRVDLIAKAVVEIANRHSEKKVVWNHFGDGVSFQKVKDILELSKAPNLSYNLNGRVLNKAVHDFYLESPVNIFINLSESEGIPVSIMEAISFGVPVIATNVGATSEIVNDTTGWLLPSDPSLIEVVDTISVSMSRDKDRSAIKEFWKHNYSAETNFSSFFQAISQK